MRYHISKSGRVTPCHAKNTCPLGTAVGGTGAKESLKNILEDKITQEGKFGMYAESGLQYTFEDAAERGSYVNKVVSMYIDSELTTDKTHRDPNTGDYTEERKAMHNEIINDFLDKYENVPTDGKVIFSAGLPGAGKTTVLKMLKDENPDMDMSRYVVVSSDDFKEEFAKRGMIPKIDGLSPMESSTLVHNESSYLADRFMKEVSDRKLNIIYDFTCKDFDSTAKRMSTLRDSGYEEKDMQFVFVDIPLETAEKRALARYAYGLNDDVKSEGKSIGGRYLPPDVLYKNKSRTGKYSSKNAEALIAINEVFKVNNLPEPIVYDNSGDTAKDPSYKPTRVPYKDFEKRRHS